MLAVGNDRQFVALCDVLGMPAVAQDPRFATNEQRVAHREELRVLLTGRLSTQSADHWFRALMARGVPCGPINPIEQGFALAAELGLSPVARVPRTAVGAPEVGQDGTVTSASVATITNPIRLSALPPCTAQRHPLLGQNGEAGIGPDTRRPVPAAGLRPGPGCAHERRAVPPTANRARGRAGGVAPGDRLGEFKPGQPISRALWPSGWEWRVGARA